MIEKIEIENFRGFRHFVCDRLAPLTVIGGRNNAGKSSLLEAMSLVFDVSSLEILHQLNVNRGVESRSLGDFDAVFYQANRANVLNVSAVFSDGSKRVRTISFRQALVKEIATGVGEPTPVESSAAMLLKKDHFESSVRVESSKLDRDPLTLQTCCYAQGEGHLEFPKAENAPDPAGLYLPPCNRKLATEFLIKLYKANQTGTIDEVLRSVDSRILEITPVENSIFAKLDGVDSRIPLGALGDGAVKIANLLAVVLSLPEGAVCAIDEIENGLHHTAMKAFWCALARVATERKVQLVVTTHNLEMMRAISSCIDNPSVLGNMAYLKMAWRNDGAIVYDSLDSEEFVTHLDQELEIR